ncbi:MAG: hypothetical protein QM703_09685 [Gemmatales bacterium]
MTTKQIEQRLEQLEREVAELKRSTQPIQQSEEPKKGWRAWVGAFSGDPFMKEAFAIAQEYRERDRRKTKGTMKRKKAGK